MEKSGRSFEQYQYAFKLGKENVRNQRSKNLNTHPLVLEETVRVSDCSKKVLGQMYVSGQLIVGTTTEAASSSFSADFMPLLNERSEFASKWQEICDQHLSFEGVKESVSAYEYLGKFYIVEGEKTVSVLRSYGVVYILADVIRLVPDQKSKEFDAYQEFLKFYEESDLYSLQFSRRQYYNRFNKFAGLYSRREWTKEQKLNALGLLERLEPYITKRSIPTSVPDCLVDLMDVYGYDKLLAMSDRELNRAVHDNKARLYYNHGLFKIVCVSDIANMDLYSDYARIELSDADFLISCGDLDPEYLEFLAKMSNKPLYYIHGNRDSRLDKRPPKGCTCIDDDLIIHKGIRILGLGGSLRYAKSKYQFSEQEMERRIRRIKRKISKYGGVDIIVTHAPIRGYGDMDDYAHQGFDCFEKLLMEYKPKFWFYGHIHQTYSHNLPRETKFKDSKIINCYERYDATY